jgi:CelD/BcsL family acetyltransferase involved in cellulose biosynthesis
MALLPLFSHQGRLLPWGAGTSDWLDGVFDPGSDPQELAPILTEIGEAMEFLQLHRASPLMKVALPEGWTERRGHSESCVTLDLPAGLSGRMAQKLRYYRRRAAHAGAEEPQRVGASHFDDMVHLHTRRWNDRGEPGVMVDPRVLAWHREALPALEKTGLLRLYALRLGNRTVAALYALASKGRVFYYIGGFDPDHSALGLGTILLGHAIAEAEREGAKRFDFLRGQEPYKYRWGGIDCPTYCRHLQPPRSQA